MKCPRTFIIEITKDDQIQLAGADCIKEECAWWDWETLECSSLSAERALRWISYSLKELVKKMPHAGQFTK